MNTYELLNLYPHNIRTCKKVKDAFDNGQDIVSIIKATGTGKSYIGLNLALEHKDEKIIWLVPTNAIKEHIEQIIFNNPYLTMEKDFPNLEIRTYSSLVNLSDEEIENIPCDLLIVDELHHIGAPVWGEKVNTLIYTHPDIKTFGMSAYSVRDRGTAYERDVTNPDTEEIFSDTVVDRYDLYDAIIDGVLPLPIAKTVLTNQSSILETLKDALNVKKLTKKEIQQEIKIVLDAIIKTIHRQNQIKEIIQEAVTENGKYIYFCPIFSHEGINDIETIKEEVVGYIKEKYPYKRIVVYQTTSDMGDVGKYNRDCFYHDVDLDRKDASDTIRIMFAKNQYNEGVHAPNVDGVFLGRKTKSDIVALEQIGRSLSVRENIKEKRREYNILEITKLKEIAKNKGIIFHEDITKEHLIELLLSPIIIDLTGNIEFLEELENNLKDRVRERRKEGTIKKKKLTLLENHSLFMLETKNKEMLLGLLNLKNQVQRSAWDDYYELALAYYKHYSNSDIPTMFKTKDGIKYDETGVSLGQWCHSQRTGQKNLSEERRKKLELINFRFENKYDLVWEKMYNLAKAYHEHYGNFDIPAKFKTKNGIDFDKSGVFLGIWCSFQRANQNNLTEERRKKLELINFRFENTLELAWQRMYELAKAYYDHHGNSEIPQKFKTKNGIKYDETGVSLGQWCNTQRIRKNNLTEERRKKLELINFRFENTLNTLPWDEYYKLAVAYYNHHGHSEIPKKYKTEDGITQSEDNDAIHLGEWCENQRMRKEKLNEERRKKLELINFRFKNKRDIDWQRIYELAKVYYEYHGNSEMPSKFKTKNGYIYDKDGVSLGHWQEKQRKALKNKALTEERRKKLEQIEFRLKTRKETTEEKRELLKTYNIDFDKYKILDRISYQELYAKIMFLLDSNLHLEIDGKLHPIFTMCNENMMINHGISKEELITNYYINRKVSK